NYLKGSIRNAGMDPDNLPQSDPSKMNFSGGGGAKAWKDIWGCGQGIGAISRVQGAGELIAQFKREYAETRARLAL
ncbi:MAG TPA: nitronate monooxygenase, partial [Burkholderiaceae bacterium]|nr:nitronate monooxygenase [Burkholderiaceae bacterium]